MKRFLVFYGVILLLTLLFPLLQLSEAARFGGVKPNFPLAFTLSLTFLISPLIPRLAFSVSALGGLLRFPGLVFPLAVVLSAALAWSLTARRLPWTWWANLTLGALFATLIIYGAIDVSFLKSHLLIIFQEGVYTALLSVFLVFFLRRFSPHEAV